MNMSVVYFECPKDKPRIKKVKKVHSLKEAEELMATIIKGTFTNSLPYDSGHIIINR